MTTLDAMRAELAAMGPVGTPPSPGVPRPAMAVDRLPTTLAYRLLDRWRAAGVTHAHLDDQGRPSPIVGPAPHASEVIVGRTSPSGKTLFRCTRPLCAHGEGPLPPRGNCDGLRAFALLDAIAAHIAAGGSFEADATGVLWPVGVTRQEHARPVDNARCVATLEGP